MPMDCIIVLLRLINISIALVAVILVMIVSLVLLVFGSLYLLVTIRDRLAFQAIQEIYADIKNLNIDTVDKFVKACKSII